MELPEMPEEGYVILVTPENHVYLNQVRTQLEGSGYLYPEWDALNIYRRDSGKWGAFTIATLPSAISNTWTLITEEQLRQLMFIYSLEN